MRILCWTQSDVGQKRDHNEDSFLVAADLGLYVVADGMGGHAGGDQASQMAVTALHETVRQTQLRNTGGDGGLGEEPEALAVLRDGARNAGAMIFDLAQQNAHLTGMGTTLTALLFQGSRVHVAHVGDSRAYLFRDGRIEQLSEDHSWINEQVKAGLITDEEARHSKFKHIITRSVGFERDVSVDVMSLPVLMGDCFVICSDGLSNYIESDELGRLLTTRYYAHIPRLLVDLANERGGDDNITVVLVYVANDSGPPLVEDLSRPDPAKATTLPGAETTGLETAGAETAGSETAAPETAGPETAGSETAGPETAVPETAGSETAAPETAVPETPGEVTREESRRTDAEIAAQEGSQTNGELARLDALSAKEPKTGSSATPGFEDPASEVDTPPHGTAPATPKDTVDPLADTAPAPKATVAADSSSGDRKEGLGTPETSVDEPTPEAPQPAGPRPPS